MDIKILSKDGITLRTKNKKVLTDISISIDDSLLGTKTADATATPETIIEGYTAYVNEQKITGTIPEYNGAFEGEVIQGVYPEGNLEITSIEQADVSAYSTAQIVDENLIAANLPKDMNILGIDGTNVMANFDTAFTVDKSEKYLRLDTELTDYGIDKIILNGQSTLEVADVVNIAVDSVNGGSIVAENLSAENIKLNTTILGVTGTLQPKLSEDETYDLSLQAKLDNSQNASYLFYKDARTDFSFLSNLNFSNVTDISNIFRECPNLTTIPQIDLSNVTKISSAFCDCVNLITVPQLDTSKVTEMYGLFYKCSNLTTIPQLDTSNATTISDLFSGCTKLTSVPELDLSKANSVRGIFQDCKNLESVSQKETLELLNATDTTYLFYNCSKLTSIPRLITPKAYGWNGTFQGCFKLESIDISHFNVYNYNSYNKYIFYNCCSLKEIKIRSFGSQYAVDSNAFMNCYHLTGTVNSTYNPNGDKDCWIRVPEDMVDTLRSASGWSTYASQIIGFNDIQVLDDIVAHTEAQTKPMTIRLYRNTNVPTSVSITSNDETITTITNIVTSTDRITFDLNFTGTIGDSIISVAIEGDYSASYTFNANFIEYTLPTYTVETVEGAAYGFTLNNSGYYESTNKGKDSSYALCKLVINNSMEEATPMALDCINYAEGGWDYGILSNLDTTLTLSSNADSSTNVYKSFKSSNSPAVQQVTYEIPSGEHFIYIKFIKDGSGTQNNDSLQFKVNFEF